MNTVIEQKTRDTLPQPTICSVKKPKKIQQRYIWGLSPTLAAAAAVMISLMASLPVYAQEASKSASAGGAAKNAVTIDVAPLAKGIIASDSDTDTGIFGIGVSYERLVKPHVSLGLRMDLYAGKVSDQTGTYFGMNAQGRIYPLSETLEKLFIEAGLGFNTLSLEGSSGDEFTGLTFALKTGWKHFFNGKIFVEPGIGYVLSKTGGYVTFTPIGWQIGLGIGLAF